MTSQSILVQVEKKRQRKLKGQSRGTNRGHNTHCENKKRKHNTTQKAKMMSNTDPAKTGDEPRCPLIRHPSLSSHQNLRQGSHTIFPSKTDVRFVYSTSCLSRGRGGLISYLRYLCLLAHSGVQHILCCVFVFFYFVLCTQCRQFLWNVHSSLLLSVFSNVYVY